MYLMKEEIVRNHKKRLFELYWETYGIFFSHLIPHPNLKIGSRGLVENEKKNGLLLIFGETSTKNLALEEDYIYAELQFGAKWETLEIPWNCVYAFYDKEQTSVSQFETSDKPLPTKVKKIKKIDNIIKVDFGKK